MKGKVEAFDLFHPLVARWFLERIGEPTPLQAQAWPKIAAGDHVLLAAPTGSGKTLAAFLWSINELVTGKWPLGRTSLIYVSPLKALNNDVQRNLIRPLEDLRNIFTQAQEPFPTIRVLTRSGDTPSSDRAKMQRRPPEILITTPESLNLLLSSGGGRLLLTHLSTVILDEIHGVLGSKRGVHLITAVDRLVLLSGEFQRIALSATVNPIRQAAEFVGGYRVSGPPLEPRYSPRAVEVISADKEKRFELRVRYPRSGGEEGRGENFWEPFVSEARKIIRRNRSTLLFTNSRRLCEKLTHLINLGEETPLAYAHHGSLSREIRAEVEGRLKSGDLRAIVATNSLELGIDIGTLDEVVMIQAPPSVSSAVQRVGRAGHHVGAVSRGTFVPINQQDILEAAVLAAGLKAQNIEAIRPVQNPLDVLAQVIVSMVGVETWDMDALYARLKTSFPYRSLSRGQFDLVLNMLAGRYADSRVRELKPRVSIDRLENSVAGRKGALQVLYFSGGTIPDRGYFHLRHTRTNDKIGELDEEFVWEARVGQTFTLGTQNWKIERITHNDVFVSPADPRATAPPFWRAEETLRDFHFSEAIGLFLETLNERLGDPNLTLSLGKTHSIERETAEGLIAFLKGQKESTAADLPHRHHLLVEHVSTGPGGYPGNQVILHTFWGGRVNRPWAMALEAAWEERFGRRPDVHVGNDCIMIQLPHEVKGEEILSLVTSGRVQGYLRKRLEGSGYFGARFRECAGRALLLPRRKMNERMPLWLSRLRSQKLLESVHRYEDFPILLETWRTCLQDEFDLSSLLQVLREFESGSILWTETRTAAPSPMARTVAWQQMNRYVYMDDEWGGGRSSRLAGSLLKEVVFTPELRPAVPEEIVREFEAKRQRLSPGYSPDNSRELLEWVKERLLLPEAEWGAILEAVKRDHGLDSEGVVKPIEAKLAKIYPPEGRAPLIAAREALPRIMGILYSGRGEVPMGPILSVPARTASEPENYETRDEEFASLLGEWLQFYGPRPASFIVENLGIPFPSVQSALEDLFDSERLVAGELVAGTKEVTLCDSENFEALLRIMRAAARPALETIPIRRLPLFLAAFQGLINRSDHMEGLFECLEQMLFFPAPAELWETELFPARLNFYDPAWLDSLLHQSDLLWLGCGRECVCFAFDEDLDLRANGKERSSSELTYLDPTARYDFSSLLRTTGLTPSELSSRLWEAVWRGEAVNDTFVALRRGIETGFKAPEVQASAPSPYGKRRVIGGRSAFSRWKALLPSPGNWRRMPDFPSEKDLIEAEEKRKERVRILLDRYGILFRELLQHELPSFRWSNVFRALRLMELSGEVLTGYFFEGISGPQFASHKAFRMLQRKVPDKVFWISAVDPASLCGVGLNALKGKLPKRTAGTHLVYRGEELVLISRGTGKKLTFKIPETEPQIQECLGVLRHLLSRPIQPLRRIVVETINGEEAAGSPYVDALRTCFDVSVDYRTVVLYRSRF